MPLNKKKKKREHVSAQFTAGANETFFRSVKDSDRWGCP